MHERGVEDLENILTKLIHDKNLDVYPLFKEFCHYKEKGLRKDAFESLNLLLMKQNSGILQERKSLLLGFLV